MRPSHSNMLMERWLVGTSCLPCTNPVVTSFLFLSSFTMCMFNSCILLASQVAMLPLSAHVLAAFLTFAPSTEQLYAMCQLACYFSSNQLPAYFPHVITQHVCATATGCVPGGLLFQQYPSSCLLSLCYNPAYVCNTCLLTARRQCWGGGEASPRRCLAPGRHLHCGRGSSHGGVYPPVESCCGHPRGAHSSRGGLGSSAVHQEGQEPCAVQRNEAAAAHGGQGGAHQDP